jgi:membrane-associated phospholipid phosphatase
MKHITNQKMDISMWYNFIVSLLLIVIYGFSSFGAADLIAQNLVSQDTIIGNKYNLSQFCNETWSLIKQPAKWEGNDWLKIGVMGAGSFLLIETVDQPARDFAFRDRSYLYSVPIEGGRIWGELYSPIVLFAGFATHSLITKDNTTRKIAFEIGQASLYTGAITYILKTAFGRARPYTNEGITSFHPFSLNDKNHSFPGGHTATSFVISTVLSRNAGPTWLKILAYLPAAITPFSRIYEDQHWVSSNFFGGALGYFIASWVVDLHEKNESRVSVSSIYPLTISVTIN